MTPIGRPAAAEYAPYYEKYIALVAGDDPVRALREQIGPTLATLRAVPPADSLRRYAPGKWSLRELVGHIVDAERVFAYRALWFARSAPDALPGFEQDDFMKAISLEGVSLKNLADEFANIRKSNISFFEQLAAGDWMKQGTASGRPVSVRALAYIIAGHELHHMDVLKTRYV